MVRKLLFSYIRIALGKDTTGFTADDKNAEALYHLAKQHDLSHLVAYGAQKTELSFPDSMSDWLQNDMFYALMRFERDKYDLECFDRVMSAEKIPYILLKGAIIRSYYPEPWMRTSCDIDILIRHEDLDRAERALVTQLNYHRFAATEHDVSFYTESHVHIELHFRLFENEHLDNQFHSVWALAQPRSKGSSQYSLPIETHVLYHICHAAKHFLCGGCGVRPLLDLWILRNAHAYNEGEVSALCSQAGLLPFYQAILKLSDVWFSSQEPDENDRKLEEFLFTGGMYGTWKRTVAITRQKQNRFSYVLGRIFVSREYLEAMYPNLRKRPMLLPWYQLCRWTHFFSKKAVSRAVTELKLADNDSVNDTELQLLLDSLDLYSKIEKI